MKQRTINIVLLTLAMVNITGCSSLWDQIDESIFSMRTRSAAKRAWNSSARAYRGIEHDLDDFGRGFVAGYAAVASGGDGCPPSLPPRRYWRTKYSTPCAKKLVVAWFDGYQHGAAAALADGYSESRRILTSGKVYNKYRERVEYEPAEIQHDFQQEQPEIMTPIPEPAQPKFPTTDNGKKAGKAIPLTPPAKPYVPEDVKKKETK